MNWLHYLLEANIYLGVFYVAYCLFLNKETHYLLNRVYLVLSTIMSFILPVLQLGILIPPLPEPTTASYFVAEQVTNVPAPIAVPVQVTAPSFTLQDGLWYVYLAGVAVLSVLFIIKLFSLFRLIRKNKVTIKDNYKIVYLKDTNAAFSFFNYLFIGSQANDAQIIMRHELVHIRQKHSADIIFLELLKIINWFNPLIYLLQNSLKTVHEYIADEKTVDDEADALSYSSFLVNNAYGISGPAITHSFFNYNLLKNRIIMLHQQRSGNLARLKYLVAVPIGAVLLCASTLGFSKTYGWIDLAPQKPEKVAIRKYPKTAVTDLPIVYSDLYNHLLKTINYHPKNKQIGSLIYVRFDLDNEGLIRNVRLANNKNPTATANAVIKAFETYNKPIDAKAAPHSLVVELYTMDSPQLPPIDLKWTSNPGYLGTFSITDKNTVKKDVVKFPPVSVLVPAGFKSEKTYVNAKGYKIEEGGFSGSGITSYIVIISDPSGKKVNFSNDVTHKKFVVYKGMIPEEKFAYVKYGYKFPDVKVSPMVERKPKVDQVRFPPPIVLPDIPADFTPEKNYVNEKGYKIQEGPFTTGGKTYYVAIISDATGKKTGTYYKGGSFNNKSREIMLYNKYGYKFPDVKVSPIIPPKNKADVIKFPPPIVKPLSTSKSSNKDDRFSVERILAVDEFTLQPSNKTPLIIVNGAKYIPKEKLTNKQKIVVHSADSIVFAKKNKNDIDKWGPEAENGIMYLYGKTSITVLPK